MAVPRYNGAPRGGRGVSRPSVRGYQSLCDTRQTGDDHAKGYPIGEENTRRLGRNGLDGAACRGHIVKSDPGSVSTR